MNILVVSNIEWSDQNAFGNTVSNFFGGMEDVNIASLYRRSAIPDNTVCQRYYRITNGSIIKSFFQKERIGNEFSYRSCEKKSVLRETTTENKVIKFIHKWHINLNEIEDMIFTTHRWENKRFKAFVEDFSPDIVFYFITASGASNCIVKSILKIKPDCKLVGFLADGVHDIAKSKRGKRIIEEQITLADKVYAISDILCSEYSQRFAKKIFPLYKGCELSVPVREKNNNPLRIVYAGNLYYGREKTLQLLAKEIAKHNESSDKKIKLEIYTSTAIGIETEKALRIDGACELFEARPYSEILEILANSDIALHVESFDEKQQQIVKYSFSTKITDCLQCGTVLFAIGPSGLASIEYAKRVPGAFVAESLDNLNRVIDEMVSANLFSAAGKNRAFATENLSIDKIRENLKNDLLNICKGR